MKYLYLGSAKIIETEVIPEEQPVEVAENPVEYESAFFDNYGPAKKPVITNIDDFNNYSLDYKSTVTCKEARTAIEEKRPFIIDKLGQSKVIEDIDNIYKTLSKMKIADKSVERVGFIQVYKNHKQVKVKNKKKYRGIANEAFLITKKKGFNQKKIGYLPLNESTYNKDLYVEITTSRGYRWLATLLIILGLLGLFVATKDWDGWKFNKERLTLYKTQETVEYKESFLNIGFNATPVLKDNNLDILLTSDFAEGLSYKAMIYDSNNELLYESDEIQAGDGLESIYIDSEDTDISNICILTCETYRNGKYIGNVESEIQILKQ